MATSRILTRHGWQPFDVRRCMNYETCRGYALDDADECRSCLDACPTEGRQFCLQCPASGVSVCLSHDEAEGWVYEVDDEQGELELGEVPEAPADVATERWCKDAVATLRRLEVECYGDLRTALRPMGVSESDLSWC
jgi:hypothetical protein